MNLQEEFAERMCRAAQQFRRELMARQDGGQILSVDEIKCDITPDGVTVKFWKQSPSGKSPKAKAKRSDES